MKIQREVSDSSATEFLTNDFSYFFIDYLFLGPNNFTSTIPEAIFKLSHLTHLFIDNCRLSGQISSSIGNLQQLQRLGLHNNFLRGSVPESIRDMKELREYHWRCTKEYFCIIVSSSRLCHLYNTGHFRGALFGRKFAHIVYPQYDWRAVGPK